MGVVRLREIDPDMPIDPSNKRRMAGKNLTEDSIRLYYQALHDVFSPYEKKKDDEDSGSSSSNSDVVAEKEDDKEVSPCEKEVAST